MKCKTCGKNAESEFCFRCKPRKPLNASQKMQKSSKRVTNDTLEMREFFRTIWNKKKKHDCENCGKWLGSEPLSYMFDHLLEKSKHPELKFEEDNIMLVCLECHDNKTRGFLTDFVSAKIEELKKRFGK